MTAEGNDPLTKVTIRPFNSHYFSRGAGGGDRDRGCPAQRFGRHRPRPHVDISYWLPGANAANANFRAGLCVNRRGEISSQNLPNRDGIDPTPECIRSKVQPRGRPNAALRALAAQRRAWQEREAAYKAMKDNINRERARLQRLHEIECNRLSQRAMEDSKSAARLYEDHCAD
jgi:hypothetical protein